MSSKWARIALDVLDSTHSVLASVDGGFREFQAHTGNLFVASAVAVLGTSALVFLVIALLQCIHAFDRLWRFAGALLMGVTLALLTHRAWLQTDYAQLPPPPPPPPPPPTTMWLWTM